MLQKPVKDIMAQNVISIGPEAAATVAISLMRKKRISFVVIASDRNEPLGVITERDIIARAGRGEMGNRPAREIMSSPVHTIPEGAKVMTAMHTLLTNNIHHLIVVNDNGFISGVVTLTNFLQSLGFEYFVEFKNVTEIMDRDPLTLPADASAFEAISSLSRKNASCLIVLDEGRPAGIFTERDAVRVVHEGKDLSCARLRDVMKGPLISAQDDTCVFEALSIMNKSKIRHLPVLGKNGSLTGLINQTDIVRGMELRYTYFLKMIIEEQGRKIKEANALLEVQVKKRTAELTRTIEQLHEEFEERKKIEAELRESEERYSLAIRGSNDGIWDRNMITGEIYYSPRWKEILGYRDDELQNSREEWEERVHPDDLEMVRKSLREHLEGVTDQYRCEYRMRHKDGSYRWILARGAIIRNEQGAPARIAGSHTDISMTRKAECEYQTIIKTAMDSFLLVDANGQIVDANDAYCQLTGYTSSELLRMSIPDVEASETHDETARHIKKIIETGYDRFNTRHRGKDGRIIELEASVKYQEEGGGRVYSFLRDITHRRQTEEERERLQGQLLQSQKMETIGTLAGGIAHDLNNILLPILCYTQLAMEGLEPEDQTYEHLEHILKATNRAKDLVRQILTFSRRGISKRETIRLQPIIKEVIKLLRASLPASIEIRSHISSDGGYVQADPTQMHQMLMNLAANAGHAMRENGGTLWIKLAPIVLDDSNIGEFPNLKNGEYLRLTVSDTGCGMDEETMRRVFDPFFTTKGLEGTGLGLSVVHGIVMGYGGGIDVTSKPGEGTTFYIYIPQVEAPEAEIAETADDKKQVGKERVLLIDDEAEISAVMEKSLKHLGYGVTARTCGLDALEEFRREPHKYDIVVTDYTMPNLNGLQLARLMKDIRKDIPIILTSGINHEVQSDNAREHGLSEIMMKPFTVDDLSKAIRRGLDGKKNNP